LINEIKRIEQNPGFFVTLYVCYYEFGTNTKSTDY